MRCQKHGRGEPVAQDAEWLADRNRQAMAFGLGAAALCAVDAGLTRAKWLAVCNEAWKWAKRVKQPAPLPSVEDRT